MKEAQSPPPTLGGCPGTPPHHRHRRPDATHEEDRFDGLTIVRDDNGTTLLTSPVVDQAALHGLLRRVRDLGLPLLSVRDLGLPLLSVRQVAPTQATGPDGAADTDHTRSNKETDR
jgi:hypothetical protein